MSRIDLTWTDEQLRFREEVRRFAASELNEDVPGRDDDERLDGQAWKRCAQFGIQGLPVPDEFGGQGADPLTTILALEALGYACTDNGLVFSLNAHMWSCEVPLIRFGSEVQRRRYLPGLADGSLIGVQAMSEPESGSDAFSMATRAERSDDGWVLNGTKTFVTNAPVADLFVVFAATNPDAKFAGISSFLVERDRSGVSVGRPFRKMGLRTSPMSEVAFSDCRVPDGALLGTPGAGMAIFNHSMLWERSCILASAIGTMERLLDRSVEHARTRRQFGRPIGEFQAVAHRIADMRTRLESSRMLVYRQAWLLGRGQATQLDAAMVKSHVSEAFLQTTLDAVQIHGAYGYLVDAELERMVRDAVGSRIYSGTSEIQRNVIAGQMGL